MKLVKMSLAAALLVSGAYALDNVKVNGSAKLIYQTTDTSTTGATGEADLFDRAGAKGQASATLGATADLVDNISAGAEFQVLSTLGLQTNLVGGVMNGTNGTTDSWNASQLWIAGTVGKTTAKVGRMELDTPLAFTEKWNIVKNTFEAAVLINSDLPDTTLVGAFVGAHNGVIQQITPGGHTVNMGLTDGTGETQGFSQFFGGAYAVAAIYSGLENTTLQAWYYNVNSIPAAAANANTTTAGTAVWLQADTKLVDMVNLGVQYATINPNDVSANSDSLDTWAVKVAGTVSDVNLFAAYSTISDSNSGLRVANFATQDKTKLFTGTGSIYMDGYIVGRENTDAWKIGASTKVADYALAASYAAASYDGTLTNSAGNLTSDVDYTAWDASVGTKVGALAVKVIYTQFTTDYKNDVVNNDVDNDTLRVIASVKF